MKTVKTAAIIILLLLTLAPPLTFINVAEAGTTLPFTVTIDTRNIDGQITWVSEGVYTRQTAQGVNGVYMGRSAAPYWRRIFVEWNISAIPVGAVITNVRFKYHGKTEDALISNGLRSMEYQPSAQPNDNTGNGVIGVDAGDGNTYYSNIPCGDAWHEIELSSYAVADLQSHVNQSLGWFAIGGYGWGGQDYVYDVIYDDSYSNYGAKLIVTYTLEDTAPPTYSNVGTNNTLAGLPTKFHALWNDDLALHGYIFGTNNTGTWVNETWTEWATHPLQAWSNVTKTLNNTDGVVVAYQFWANDTANNWETTGTHYVTAIIDTTPPTYSDISYNTTKVGAPVLFKCYWTDNVELSGFIFSTNNTGTWLNDTWVPLSGNTSWANVEKTLNNTLNLVIGFRWYCNDTSNNWNDTGIHTLTTSSLEFILHYPLDNTVTVNTTPSFNFTAVSSYSATINCTLYIDGVASGTVSASNNTVATILCNHTLTESDVKKEWRIRGDDGSAVVDSSSRYIGIGANFRARAILIDPNTTYKLTASYSHPTFELLKAIEIKANNITLNGQGYAISFSPFSPDPGMYGIYINGYDFITVKNISFSNWYDNIYITNSKNNTLTNVSPIHDWYYGVRMINVNYTLITNSTFGILMPALIHLENCFYNTIQYTTTFSSESIGVHLINSHFTTINHVTSYNCEHYGMLLENSNNNIITNFVTYGNGYKVGDGCGIKLSNSHNNTLAHSKIYGNTVGKSVKPSLRIASSGQNLIYNNFFNDTTAVTFAGTIYTNYWNTTKQEGVRIYSAGNMIGGNFWAKPDHTGFSETCNDTDKDGFSDDPYTLTTNNIDYLPYSDEYALVTVTIVVKPENITYTSSTIPVEITAEGGTIDKIWYNCKNGTEWIYGSNITYTAPTSMTGFVNGTSYTFYAWANSTEGYQDEQTVMFTVAIPPEEEAPPSYPPVGPAPTPTPTPTPTPEVVAPTWLEELTQYFRERPLLLIAIIIAAVAAVYVIVIKKKR